MEHKQNNLGDSAAIPAGRDDQSPSDPPATLDFQPVAVARRSDGWTPGRQRGFILALADCGRVREAAARVGMSERSANYLRRRPGGAAFSRAWDAAIQLRARQLRSVAYERAVLGRVKQHFYRGRLVGEERVYDDHLLRSLLAKADKSIAPADGSAVLADWDGWMDAIENGLDAPQARPAERPGQARARTDAQRDLYFAGLR